MRREGRESWRFADDIDQTLHALLYVRDALGVGTEDMVEARGIPPRLAGYIPARSRQFDSDVRQEVARHWLAWWERAVAAHAQTELGAPGVRSSGELLREIVARHRLVADPPEWSSLTSSPALQQAARALYSEGCRWADIARRPLLPPACRGVFNWELVRDAAEHAVPGNCGDRPLQHRCDSPPGVRLVAHNLSETRNAAVSRGWTTWYEWC